MTWSAVVFVAAFTALVYFVRDMVRVWQSAEFKSDVERLRDMRRTRKASRR